MITAHRLTTEALEREEYCGVLKAHSWQRSSGGGGVNAIPRQRRIDRARVRMRNRALARRPDSFRPIRRRTEVEIGNKVPHLPLALRIADDGNVRQPLLSHGGWEEVW